MELPSGGGPWYNGTAEVRPRVGSTGVEALRPRDKEQGSLGAFFKEKEYRSP